MTELGRAVVTLTPRQSKRLIAEAFVELPEVKEALQNGIIVVSTGSTNAAIVAKLLGKDLGDLDYLSGAFLPTGVTREEVGARQVIPDVVLRCGELAPELDRNSALQEMGEGDIFVKGANALNYEQGLAAVSVGSDTGGTIGKSWGYVIGRRLKLIIPVGLEKSVAQNILDVAALANSAGRTGLTSTPRLAPVRGQLLTEIEAVKTLYNLTAYHFASGGLAGAEGGVTLLIEGPVADVTQAVAGLESIPLL